MALKWKPREEQKMPENRRERAINARRWNQGAMEKQKHAQN